MSEIQDSPTDDGITYAREFDAPRSRGLAIASLVLGILGVSTSCLAVGVAPSIVGGVLGLIAIMRARRRPERHAGKHMAIVGVCCCGLGLVLVPLAPRFEAPEHARELAIYTLAAARMTDVARAVYAYADQHEEFPPDLQSLVAAGLLEAESLRSPWRTKNAECDFSYFTGLTVDDDSRWILAYFDPADGPSYEAYVLYADGHVEGCPKSHFPKLIQKFVEDYKRVRGVTPTRIPPR